MSSLISFSVLFTYCLLVMERQVLGGPMLLADIEDPNDMVIVGDTISLQCATDSIMADEFFLILNQTNSVVTLKQKSSTFIITNILQNYTGLYTCYDCYQSKCSEPSDAVSIYVRDTFPEPTIIVVPRKIVQPGQDVTIICSAPYPNIMFSFYKYNKLIKEDHNDGNQSSYEIKNAREEDSGQYKCSYSRKPDIEPVIHSLSSNPSMIRVKVLPKPSISLKTDPGGNGTRNIHCAAPDKYKRMWFQLFTNTNDIKDEIEVVNENYVTFNIKEPINKNQKYHCIYRIKIGDSLADSLFSDTVYVGSGDHTMENIIRLLLGAMILLLAGFIFLKHFGNFKKIEECAPELPPLPDRCEKEAEESKVESECDL